MADPMLLFHYDLKHAMWQETYTRRTTSTLRSWGYTGILLEIEDKYRFPRYPSFAHPDALNRKELATLAADLRTAGMTVIPLVQSLGHAEYILRHDEFAALRESPAHTSQYDPLSATSQTFLKDMIDEIIDITQPEQYFHLGGDETWNLGQSEKCRETVKKIGTGGLYLKHMLPLFEHLNKHNLRPIIWPDIVLAHPEVIDQIPPYVAMMDWDYWTGGKRWPDIRIWGKGVYNQEKLQTEDLPEFREHLERYAVDDQTRKDSSFRAFYCMDALKDKGFEAFLAPATRSHGDTLAFPEYAVHDPNCFYAARKGMKEGLGCCVTSWAVRHSHPELNLVSAFAAAQALREDADFSASALAEAYSWERYGVRLPKFEKLQRIAELKPPFSASHTVWTKNLAEDKKAIQDWLKTLDATDGGRETEKADIQQKKQQFSAGLVLTEQLRAQAKRNQGDFDFWRNGLQYLQFCADFSLAVLAENPAAQRPALLIQLQEIRKQTAHLFATTYPPHSTVEETARRLSMHQRVLLSWFNNAEQPFDDR